MTPLDPSADHFGEQMVSKCTGTVRPDGRNGGVSIQMTADALLSLSVNIANGWSLDDLGYDATEKNFVALQKMLAGVYEQVLLANRQAARKRLGRRRRDRGVDRNESR